MPDEAFNDNSLGLVQPYLISGEGLEVHDPASGKIIARVKTYSAEETTSIIEAAEVAYLNWRNLTAKMRAGLLRNWHDLILAHQAELARIATFECGKPLSESVGEVAYAAAFIEWFAEEGKRAYGDVIPHHAPGKRLVTIKQPVGVTAAITPWNFPLAMITRKAGPALAAGCTMIVKPAEATPLSALALEALAIQAGIPRDVFRIVPTTQPADIGRIFCESPLIRKISFTGSTPVGKRLIAQCAGTVKRVSMELGGNAPFIVFDDADIEAAIDGAMVAKYRNAGQTCVCANRFFVQDGIYDAFVKAFAAKVSKLKVGYGIEPGTDIGPLINKSGIDKVAALVEQAVGRGAKKVVGGAPHALGDTFYQPTILSHVTPDMDIAQAEIFGPVAPVFRFKSEADAIRLANDTPFGLAAYFYSRDIGRIWRVMEALEYGMVGINDGLISTEVAPFGGIKESGIGREGSRLGIDEYLEIKYALIGGLNP